MGLEEIGSVCGIAFLVVTATVVPIVTLFLVKLNHRLTLAPLARDLGGKMTLSIWRGFYVSFMTGDFESKIMLAPKGKHSPPMMVLLQQGDLECDFKISKEGVSSRAFEKIGLINDLKVGDPKFDDHFCIRSDDEDQAVAALSDRERKQAIRGLVKAGFSELFYKKQTLKTIKSYYEDEDLDPDLIRERFGLMLQLVAKE